APRNLQATPGDGQVTLNWQPPSNDGGSPILLYTIYRGNSSGGESFLITVPLVTTYTDATVTNGVTYYYKVSATNAIGEGPKSNEASATPSAPATPPGAPQGLSATPGATTVSLTWSPPRRRHRVRLKAWSRRPAMRPSPSRGPRRAATAARRSRTTGSIEAPRPTARRCWRRSAMSSPIPTRR